MNKQGFILAFILLLLFSTIQYGCENNKVCLFNGYKIIKDGSDFAKVYTKNGFCIVHDMKKVGLFWAKYPFVYGDYTSKDEQIKFFILDTETGEVWLFNNNLFFSVLKEKKLTPYTDKFLTSFHEQITSEKLLIGESRRLRFKETVNQSKR